MRTTSTLTATLAAATAALVLAACGSTGEGATATGAAGGTASASVSATDGPAASSPTGPTRTPASGDVMAAGAYLTQEQYQGQMAAREGTKVVYFFHAPWCPDCRSTDQAIARDGVPAGLTVVKVDFDSQTDLRRELGVTQQHTFVQVGPDGAELAKWTGSQDGAGIAAKTV